MLYGCVAGCGIGCASCAEDGSNRIGAAYPSHYDPYTGEKIEGLGILPPPAYVTAPPGAFTYYKPQPIIGKGVSFLPKVSGNAEDAAAPVDAAEKQLAVMPETALSGKTILVAAAAIAVLVGYRNWKKR